VTKKEIRAQIGSQRRSLDPAWISAHSRRIEATVLGLPVLAQAKTVGCYLALPGEVETEGILRHCWEAGKRVCVPAMREETACYEMAAMQADTAVVRRPGNGPEPVSGDWVRPADVDLLIVPGVAFDDGCGRLGRGGGHYDRIMEGLAEAGNSSPVFWGLGFEFQIVRCVPMAAHDVRLDLVVTQERVLRASRRVSA